MVDTVKFSEFTDGGELQVGDTIVGLRSSTNYKFSFPSDGFKDSDGNYLLKWAAPASAVNYIEFSSSAAADPLKIEAKGSDTNIHLDLYAKGSGSVRAFNSFVVDNLTFNGNQIEATDTDGNITLIPNGSGHVDIFEPPSTEVSGINIHGTTYNACFRVNDIGGSAPAQNIIHRHSSTLPPALLGARSNSDTDAHAAVTNGQSLLTVYGAGWATSYYNLFGAIDISADSSGTISDTSAPGRIRFQVTANGAFTPTTALTINNDKSATFGGVVLVPSDIQHVGDTNNKIAFGTDTQDFQTGGSSRLDISDSGVRLGGANTRVTTILDEDNMASDSATALASQQSIKAYCDATGAKLTDIKVYTSNDTWTKPAAFKANSSVVVYVTGGGGGGGGANQSGSGVAVGSAGGGGGTSIKHILNASLGATETVTVGAAGTAGVGSTTTNGGAGGSSSFGAHATATGGSGGTTAPGRTANDSRGQSSPIAGGIGASGDINLEGGYGTVGVNFGTATNGLGGVGGSTFWGQGGGNVIENNNGTNTNVPGTGGGCGVSATTTDYDGAAGRAGIVVVYEFT